MSALWVYNFYIMLAVLLVATLLQSERLNTHQRVLWAPAQFYQARTHIKTWVNSFQLLVLEHAIAPHILSHATPVNFKITSKDTSYMEEKFPELLI